VISRRRAHHVLVVVGVAVAAVLATAWWLPGPAMPGREHAGVGLAAMALPLFVGLAASVRGTWRVTWLVAAASAFAFVVLAGGLAGRCALGAIVLCGGLALVATRRALRVGWAGVIVGSAVIVMLCVRTWTPERPAKDVATLLAREHTALVKAGVAMGADRPLLGHGPGMVAWSFPQYRARFSVIADEVSALSSTPVQIWAEHGVLGLLAMASLTLGVGLRAWRLRPRGIAAEAGSHEDRVRAWSVVGALGARRCLRSWPHYCRSCRH
jgi:O-antigen ligase